jgi:hypothetical protein
MEQVRNSNFAARNQGQKAKRPFDPTNNRGRGYGKLWAVYPDFWAKGWGQKPCLGHVRADTAYDAVYAAYDKGLSHPNNCSFGLEVVQQDPLNRKPRNAQ